MLLNVTFPRSLLTCQGFRPMSVIMLGGDEGQVKVCAHGGADDFGVIRVHRARGEADGLHARKVRLTAGRAGRDDRHKGSKIFHEQRS